MRIEPYKKSLDELETDVLVTTLFSDERPPRGVTGLVDWRLDSFLSQRMIDKTIVGNLDETVLVPLHRRLPARRLVIFGLGKRDKFTLRRAQILGLRMGTMIARLSTIDVAMSAPVAVDESFPGETERNVMESLKKVSLPEALLLRWLDTTAGVLPELFPAETTEVIRAVHAP